MHPPPTPYIPDKQITVTVPTGNKSGATPGTKKIDYSKDGALTAEGLAWTLRTNFSTNVDVLTRMLAIALAESNGDPYCEGGPNSDGTYDYGVWQINSSHSTEFEMGQWFNPDVNLVYAKKVALKPGGTTDIQMNQFDWTAWRSFNNAKYLAFMPVAKAAITGQGGPLDKGEVTPDPTFGLGGLLDDLPKLIKTVIGGLMIMFGVLLLAKNMNMLPSNLVSKVI